jgi:hypothetical protein
MSGLVHSDTTTGARRAARRMAGATLVGAFVIASVIGITESTSIAAEPHTGCQPVAPGGTSGWCGLYPGNATSNTKELGMVTVSSDGNSIVVNTENAADGNAPGTSFVCLVATPAAQITERLQDRHCDSAGGVWLPFTGGSLTIDLAQYVEFENTTFTIQVAANEHAANANGDSFYNNLSVSTVSSGGLPS